MYKIVDVIDLNNSLRFQFRKIVLSFEIVDELYSYIVNELYLES